MGWGARTLVLYLAYTLSIGRAADMINEELLAILVCPSCRTKLQLVGEKWLACLNPDCARKYPIIDDIPNMLIEEGSKYIHVAIQDLESIDPR